MSDLTKVLEGLDETQLASVYMRVFNTDDGKLVLADLANRCFDEVSTIPEGAVDPFNAVRNEGRRSVLLYVRTMLKPHDAVKMEESNA
jgi:hypothetical protein